MASSVCVSLHITIEELAILWGTLYCPCCHPHAIEQTLESLLRIRWQANALLASVLVLLSGAKYPHICFWTLHLLKVLFSNNLRGSFEVPVAPKAIRSVVREQYVTKKHTSKLDKLLLLSEKKLQRLSLIFCCFNLNGLGWAEGVWWIMGTLSASAMPALLSGRQTQPELRKLDGRCVASGGLVV